MDTNEIISYVTMLGIPVAILSFIAYVFNPADVFIAFFAIGVVMMVAGYTILTYQSRKLSKEIDSTMEEVERRGYIMSLDEDYVPYQDEATIEVLE